MAVPVFARGQATTQTTDLMTTDSENNKAPMAITTHFAAARINLSRLITIAMIAGLAITDSLWAQQQPWVGHIIALLGWLLVGTGVMGRIWAGSYICGHKNKKLMMEGPYSLCRNPLYLFSFIGGLGAMLVTQTLLFPALFALTFLSYYQPVMRNEEKTLKSIHGESFEAYRQAVPLFWPRSLKFVEPKDYSLDARRFRRFLIEVIWFIVIAAVVQAVHQLHAVEVLPVWFRVY